MSERLGVTGAGLSRADGRAVAWHQLDGLSDYADTLERMERTAEAIASGDAGEQVWLLEHPPVYTAGTSTRDGDLLSERFPVHRTGRGGQLTYHGPGQRVAYVMLNLTERRRDVRAYVAALEAWLTRTLASMNVAAERREDRVGLWVPRPEKAPLTDGAPREDKIAAIGVRLKRWVTLHGIAVNVDPELDHFAGIVPCGVRGHGVTSLHDLGHLVSMHEFDMRLRCGFERVFGPTKRTPPARTP